MPDSTSRRNFKEKVHSLLEPVSALRGIGPAKAQALGQAGINLLEDILYFFPRRYIDRSIQASGKLTEGQQVTLILQVDSSFVAHGRKSRLMVQTQTASGERITLVWFRRYQYFKTKFQNGLTLIVSGKLDFFNGLQMAHPDFEILDEEDQQNLLHVGRIIPLYPSSEELGRQGFDSRGFRRLIGGLVFQADEILPEVFRSGHMTRAEALRNIHYPASAYDLERAIAYLKQEELFLFLLLMKEKANKRQKNNRKIKPVLPGKSKKYAALLERLPFQLTNGQKEAIQSIAADCQKNHTEAFLLQGDVGSGKTLVAFACALLYLEAGAQAAFLAPTDVLARQHFQSLNAYTELLTGPGLELLTGSGSKKEREKLLESLARGATDLVIGTHALFSEDVRFKNLAFVIIDEQHRFGVEQRDSLLRKGQNPDTLAMTATPIPRTLCLTAFADLKLLLLEEKPSGRGQIKTMWLKENQRGALYKSIRKYVNQGRQCFIVYPVIEESEKVDLRAATDAFEEIKEIFNDCKVALLHGRLKPREKDEVMRGFRQGQSQILVTTSIVEVGVDIPNATIMVIEHAERFGISQLHQLRGRVGRGAHESFCIFMTPPAVTPEADERLQALVASQDGFFLADVDLKLRGPGELLGFRQHGFPGLRLADLHKDRHLAEETYEKIRAFDALPEDLLLVAGRRFYSEKNLFGFT